MSLCCDLCFCPIEDGEPHVSCNNNNTTSCCSNGEQNDLQQQCHHYHLEGCLQNYFDVLAQSLEDAALQFWAQHEKLECPLPGCLCGIDEDQLLCLASAASKEIIKKYFEVKRRLACSVERKAAMKEAEKKALASSDEAKRELGNRMILEIREILTTCIACPHCKQPFIDFDGCLALTCGSCSAQFCGVCLQVHAGEGKNADSHQMVSTHLKSFGPTLLQTYGFHSNYFISSQGWGKWSEKLKIDSIVRYLKGIRKELVWDFFRDVAEVVRKEKWISEEGCQELYRSVFAHDVGAVHLVRIPNTFWLLYSTKHNITFEQAIQCSGLTNSMKLDMGKFIVAKVRKAFPSWEPIKTRVPGEQFESINYPPEVLPIVAKAMEEWGVLSGCWQ